MLYFDCGLLLLYLSCSVADLLLFLSNRPELHAFTRSQQFLESSILRIIYLLLLEVSIGARSTKLQKFISRNTKFCKCFVNLCSSVFQKLPFAVILFCTQSHNGGSWEVTKDIFYLLEDDR